MKPKTGVDTEIEKSSRWADDLETLMDKEEKVLTPEEKKELKKQEKAALKAEREAEKAARQADRERKKAARKTKKAVSSEKETSEKDYQEKESAGKESLKEEIPGTEITKTDISETEISDNEESGISSDAAVSDQMPSEASSEGNCDVDSDPSKEKKSLPNPTGKKIAGILKLFGIVLLCVLIAGYLIFRFAFPDEYNRVYAELFVHADPIVGEDIYLLAELEMSFETEESGILEEAEADIVKEAAAVLYTKVMEYNEKNFAVRFEAEAAYILDDTGAVVYAKNEHEVLYPASMTKLLTALVVMDQVEDLDSMVTISELDTCYESGSVLLMIDPEDQMSVRDLLHGLLMCSYNDTAEALAIEFGGSVEGFADLMNAKAAELGCVDSHFANPHGLFNEKHYSSAYDMTLIVKAAIENETLQEILVTKEWDATLVGASGTVYEKYFDSSSSFLNEVYDIPGFTFTGGKTGYIMKARSCVATTFMGEDGHQYYSCVMKALDAQYMTALLYRYVMAPFSMKSFMDIEPVMKAWQLDYEEGAY